VKFGAFSFSGQKCSTTSRVYVHEDIADEFTEQLVEGRRTTSPSASREPGDGRLSLIDDSAIERYDDICETAAADGTVLTGGSRASTENLPTGRYVRADRGHGHSARSRARDGRALPFVTIHPVSSLEEGITKANDSDYGLCAGLFSGTRTGSTWFDRIESGMCYVNREQSATTGALVEITVRRLEVLGTTGEIRGRSWYLQQFMRQQKSDCGRRRRTALDRHSNRRTDLRPTVRLRNIPD